MNRPENGPPESDVPLPADRIADGSAVPDVPAFDPQYPAGRPSTPGPRFRYGRDHPESRVRSAAELSLLLNTCAALLCFGFVSVAGVVLAAVALHRSDTASDAGRRPLRASWLCLVASLLVSVVLLVTLIVLPAVDLVDRIRGLW